MRTGERGAVRFLDPDKVRRARIACGIGEQTIAAALGVSSGVWHRLETGVDQRFLTLAFVRDVARVLGCHFDELLVEPDLTVPEPDVLADDDSRTVGAVLAALGQPAQVDGFAVSLGWTLERTLVALEHLEDVLAPTGQRLVWDGDASIRLSVAGDTSGPVATLVAASFAECGIDLIEARLLAAAAAGTAPVRWDNGVRICATRLMAGGLVEPGADNRPSRPTPMTLTETARFDLVLD